MAQYFQQLHGEVGKITSYSPQSDRDAFFTQEILRFISVAGTIQRSFQNIATNINERLLSHILIRSVIENYFRILYIFDDKSISKARFDSCVNGFKIEYAKLYNDPWLPRKNQLQQPDPSWPSLQKPMDLNSMLTALWNVHGNRLNYLYFVYRVSSFDTHGNNLEALFNASFKVSPCNFPVLKLDPVIELIANEYLVIWNGGNIL